MNNILKTVEELQNLADHALCCFLRRYILSHPKPYDFG